MSNAAPWAYSRLKKFQTCPKQYYHLLIAKDYEEDFSGEHIRYGNEVHKAAEKYITEDKPLPEHMQFMVPVLDSLKSKPGEKFAELRIGLTQDLTPCDFFAKDVWWRGVIDLLIIDEGVAFVIDYKTGKSKWADTDQLEQMALAVFKHYPEVHTIRAGLLFVVTDDFIKETYAKDDEARLWKKWLREFGKLEKAHENDVWNPSPSGLCKRHCIVLECPHNGRNE